MTGETGEMIVCSPAQVGEQDTKATIIQLARLNLVEYDNVRVEEAVKLGCRAVTLDKLVKQERSTTENDSVLLADSVPADQPVNGAALLDEITATVRRYIVLPNGAAETVALWTMHANCHDTAQISPILGVTSPTPECGKTSLLGLIAPMTPKALSASNISSSAVYRTIEKYQPTLLIDEADTFLKDNEQLRGVLNSGHNRAAAYVIRMVGEGSNMDTATFKTWAPKCIALIGRLPATLASRSIHIELRRMAPHETVEPLRMERLDLSDIRSKASRWARDNDLALRDAEPDMPDSLQGCAADNWRHLIAIADLAGGDWPERARAIAQTAAAKVSESTTSVMLLEDIKAVFAEVAENAVSSEVLVNHLAEMETRPWSEWKRGKPITQRQLANLLDGFKIKPGSVRIGDKTPKGYRISQFTDAFSRYLQHAPPHRHNPQKTAGNNMIQSATTKTDVADLKGPKPAGSLTCGGVADENPSPGNEGDHLFYIPPQFDRRPPLICESCGEPAIRDEQGISWLRDNGRVRHKRCVQNMGTA